MRVESTRGERESQSVRQLLEKVDHICDIIFANRRAYCYPLRNDNNRQDERRLSRWELYLALLFVAVDFFVAAPSLVLVDDEAAFFFAGSFFAFTPSFSLVDPLLALLFFFVSSLALVPFLAPPAGAFFFSADLGLASDLVSVFFLSSDLGCGAPFLGSFFDPASFSYPPPSASYA